MSANLIPIRTLIRRTGLVVLVAATASCGDVVRSSRAPVFLVINSLEGAPGQSPDTLGGTLNSDVITNVTTPAPCTAETPCPTIFNDVASATLSVAMKDVTVTPTTNNSVTITHYRVSYRRSDGRNTPGVDVPFGFDGGVTVTIPAGGTGAAGFEIVRHVAKEEAPLVQLKVVPNIITTTADVTFFGRDVVGNDVSATGSILINFGNFGDIQ